ncbi:MULTISPECIES: hypothetical protein [Enterococcus]|uniref:Uncharacterized protein n=1 Tax=Candidatus Enterococcus murrayae TaxID=2815321 RepID=A0ABS3HCF1_9ENTE|nr:hypothetical protein [Enterococcus sp. MJM16]MBO0451120.1 hypothetical protein [Enterococcus sp. MJM16]
MKKILSGLLVGSVLFGGAASIYAAEENVNGTNSASITVNGSLGQDNTDENGPNIDEGSEDWINVTVDTANIFYTTKDTEHKTITSPYYAITNNSGRGVKISVADFTVDSGNLDNVEALEISGKDYSAMDKTVDLKSFAAGEFLVLANNQGKLNVDTDPSGGYTKDTLYKYSGTTKDEYYKGNAEQTSHTLTLAFEALGKDGNPVTP